MNQRLLTALAALLVGAGLALGQRLEPIPAPSAVSMAPAAGPVLMSSGPDLAGGHDHGFAGGGDEDCGRCFGSVEYLLWWFKGAPLSIPIAATNTPGAGGGTSVLSPSTLDYGPFSGVRLTGGMWVNDDHTMGEEVGGFVFGARVSNFLATGTAAGPPLFVPFLNVSRPVPVEALVPIAGVHGHSGLVAVHGATQLWGGEENTLFNLIQDDEVSVNLLLGTLYLDLDENLNLVGNTSSPTIGTQVGLDRFSTRNQFLGFNIGGRAQMAYEGMIFCLIAEVALGGSREGVTANGVSTIIPPTGPAFELGRGFFVRSTDAGRRKHEEFVVVPRVQAQVGYDLCQNVRVTVGYDFLYMSDVVRPGDQIDRRINVLGTPGIVGPGPLFLQSDFWAQGLEFGVAMRF
jgi:hypothetical protein